MRAASATGRILNLSVLFKTRLVATASLYKHLPNSIILIRLYAAEAKP
jgi:hypothetical protein